MQRENLTKDEYLAYMLATQSKWTIFELETRDQYDQVFRALEKSERVKQLDFCIRLLGFTDQDLLRLAASLDANNTLEGLGLQGLDDASEYVLVEIFNVLTRKPKITSFALYNFALPPFAWRAFLEFIRAHPNLKKLTIRPLTETQVVELMEALSDNEELNSLSLGGTRKYHRCATNRFEGDNSGTLESLKAVARFVSESTKLTHLSVIEDNLTPETAAEVIEIMQNNTSLYSVDSYGELAQSQFLRRNREAYMRRQKNSSVPKADIEAPVKIEPGVDSKIEELPADLMRLMLWQLDIKSLFMFKRVSKRFNSLMKEDKFWRGYYLKYFSCIPGDVLALTDITYGLKLIAASSMDQVTSLWEEIVVNSYRLRTVKLGEFPTNYSVPFMVPVYRQYPQLIGTNLSECLIDVFSPDRPFLKTKDAPYSNTWFTLFAHNEAVYHLGFEKLHDGQYNGIVFVSPDTSEWRDRFYHMRYLFEWFGTKDEVEFADKAKALCEVYLAARDTRNHGPIQAPFFKNIAGLLESAIRLRTETIRAINLRIEQSAQEFCTKHGINETNSESFVKMVEQMTQQYASEAKITDTEFKQFKQKLPARSTLNQKYRLGNGDFHNFNTQSWGPLDNTRQKYNKAHQPKKHSKSIGHVVLMKFYRVVLNCKVMPMLQTFWPMDINDPDCELYPFIQWAKDAKPLYQDLYCSNYRPFSGVSIHSAAPAQWPVIAVGLANVLLPSLIDEANNKLIMCLH